MPTRAPAARATRAAFESVFGRAATGLAFAPGRVNLIGEHTDYNDGFVLPMAIDRGVTVAFAPRGDRVLRAHAAAYGETREVALDGLAPPAPEGFLGYVAGVAWAFEEAGLRLPGLDLAILGDLPIGAGLSSSAALELSVARAFAVVGGHAWDPPTMARLAQRAENGFVGIGSGIMDHFVSAAAQEGCALLLDCRSLETRDVPLPPTASVVVMDTGLRRALLLGEYNERRAACERAAAALAGIDPGVRSLRDANLDLLERGRGAMDEIAWRRARHVVPEVWRPLEMVEALAAGDLPAAGRLMDASHASLRDLYEVSGPELDAMVETARAHPACFGARLTGAGFGGCAVALVSASDAGGFQAHVRAGYRQRTGREADVFTCQPAGGARLLA
jgi:galactokinase